MPKVNSEGKRAVILDLDAVRSATKAAQRVEMARQIAAGEISPQQAQERNAPISKPVEIVDLWSAVRRHTPLPTEQRTSVTKGAKQSR